MFMGPAFTVMARPLFELMKKDVVFEWREKHTAALRALKQLINYTTLQIPDPNRPFVLRSEAFGFAYTWGCSRTGRETDRLPK